MAEIILFGIGATAEVLHYHLTREGRPVAAFAVDADYLRESSLLGCPVVAFEELEQHFSPAVYELIIAIGYARVNQLRAERCAQALARGYRLQSYISPTAILWDDLSPGYHCRIGEKSLIQPFARIGDNVSVGSDCLIGHHSSLGDHCFLASRVTLGGGVVVEPYAFLGTGAIVRNKARIAAHSVVGAGAVILADTRPGGVYVAQAAEALEISSDALAPA